MKKIISIGEIIEWNHLLEEKKINYKIHLRDACGGQSFYITDIKGDENEHDIEKIKREIVDVIKSTGVEIRFLENQSDFVIDNN